MGDFRFDHAALLDRLLSESLTAPVAEGRVNMEEIAIDETKEPAPAKAREGGGDGTTLGRL